MPVLGVEDGRAGNPRLCDLGIDEGHDLLAAGDVQAACRIGKVVLHIDHDERRRRVVDGHEPRFYVRSPPNPGVPNGT